MLDKLVKGDLRACHKDPSDRASSWWIRTRNTSGLVHCQSFDVECEMMVATLDFVCCRGECVTAVYKSVIQVHPDGIKALGVGRIFEINSTISSIFILATRC